MKNTDRNEQVEISFLGMKLKCSNPTNRTIIIIVLALIFFVVLLLFLPKLSLYISADHSLSKIKWFSG